MKALELNVIACAAAAHYPHNKHAGAENALFCRHKRHCVLMSALMHTCARKNELDGAAGSPG
eukprot:scaffold137124_cov17-Tisochrysis_lutea.AAC.1